MNASGALEALCAAHGLPLLELGLQKENVETSDPPKLSHPHVTALQGPEARLRRQRLAAELGIPPHLLSSSLRAQTAHRAQIFAARVARATWFRQPPPAARQRDTADGLGSAIANPGAARAKPAFAAANDLTSTDSWHQFSPSSSINNSGSGTGATHGNACAATGSSAADGYGAGSRGSQPASCHTKAPTSLQAGGSELPAAAATPAIRDARTAAAAAAAVATGAAGPGPPTASPSVVDPDADAADALGGAEMEQRWSELIAADRQFTRSLERLRKRESGKRGPSVSAASAAAALTEQRRDMAAAQHRLAAAVAALGCVFQLAARVCAAPRAPPGCNVFGPVEGAPPHVTLSGRLVLLISLYVRLGFPHAAGDGDRADEPPPPGTDSGLRSPPTVNDGQWQEASDAARSAAGPAAAAAGGRTSGKDEDEESGGIGMMRERVRPPEFMLLDALLRHHGVAPMPTLELRTLAYLVSELQYCNSLLEAEMPDRRRRRQALLSEAGTDVLTSMPVLARLARRISVAMHEVLTEAPPPPPSARSTPPSASPSVSSSAAAPAPPPPPPLLTQRARRQQQRKAQRGGGSAAADTAGAGEVSQQRDCAPLAAADLAPYKLHYVLSVASADAASSICFAALSQAVGLLQGRAALHRAASGGNVDTAATGTMLSHTLQDMADDTEQLSGMVQQFMAGKVPPEWRAGLPLHAAAAATAAAVAEALATAAAECARYARASGRGGGGEAAGAAGAASAAVGVGEGRGRGGAAGGALALDSGRLRFRERSALASMLLELALDGRMKPLEARGQAALSTAFRALALASGLRTCPVPAPTTAAAAVAVAAAGGPPSAPGHSDATSTAVVGGSRSSGGSSAGGSAGGSGSASRNSGGISCPGGAGQGGGSAGDITLAACQAVGLRDFAPLLARAGLVTAAVEGADVEYPGPLGCFLAGASRGGTGTSGTHSQRLLLVACGPGVELQAGTSNLTYIAASNRSQLSQELESSLAARRGLGLVFMDASELAMAIEVLGQAQARLASQQRSLLLIPRLVSLAAALMADDDDDDDAPNGIGGGSMQCGMFGAPPPVRMAAARRFIFDATWAEVRPPGGERKAAPEAGAADFLDDQGLGHGPLGAAASSAAAAVRAASTYATSGSQARAPSLPAECRAVPRRRPQPGWHAARRMAINLHITSAMSLGDPDLGFEVSEGGGDGSGGGGGGGEGDTRDGAGGDGCNSDAMSALLGEGTGGGGLLCLAVLECKPGDPTQILSR